MTIKITTKTQKPVSVSVNNGNTAAVLAKASELQTKEYRDEVEQFSIQVSEDAAQTLQNKNLTEGYKNEAEADRVQTGLDRIQTGLDRFATGEDRIQTGLDRTQTGLDKTATAADRVQTGLDKTQTGLDRVQTGQDRTATASDRVQTGLDVVQTNADRVATGQDKTQTGLDRIQTGLDKTATAADRIQTGLDVQTTNSNKTQTNLDVQATAADRVQTGLDRTQTGLDVTTSLGYKNAAKDSADAALLSEQTADQHRLAAENSKIAAEAAKTAAEASETNAEGSAIAAAADRLQTGLDRAQTGLDVQATAADRVQTGLDRTQTGLDAQVTSADRIQTGLDRTATAADRIQTGLDVVQTNADKETTNLYKIASEDSAELSRKYAENPEDEPVVDEEYSAKHWFKKTEIAQGIAGSFATSAVDAAQQAQQAAADAVAVVTGGTASLTPQAGKIPIAGASGKIDTEWLDPLPGVTAEALHRSPNAVTSIFVYDTSKDSDGGAWTEKCQHTSWYNEAINGKWLGAQASELNARMEGATLGSELVTNGTFDSDTSGWTKYGTGTGSVVANEIYIISGNSGGDGYWQDFSGLNSTKTYVVTGSFRAGAGTAFFSVRQGTGSFGTILNSTSTSSTTSISYKFTFSGQTGVRIYIGATSTGYSGYFDNISVCEVLSTTTQTGDYFQLTTDGKFYKLNATSGITEVFRGNKRDFPRLAAIVAEAANVTIYDLTEPGRPMWMRFNASSNGFVQSSAISIYALNGHINFGYGNASGLGRVWFATDVGEWWLSGVIRAFTSSISNRNYSTYVAKSGGISNATVNAVAMTVLPDAPVDPVTGLRIPTIAVATGGGVSVIKHNGTVVTPYAGGAGFVEFTQDYRLRTKRDVVSAYYISSDWRTAQSPTSPLFLNGTSSIPNIPNTNFTKGFFAKNYSLMGLTGEIAAIRENPGSYTKSSVFRIKDTYNTGHMAGDIRRTYLSDIDAGSVGPSTELVANGAFDTDTGWTKGSGWAISSGKLNFSYVSGYAIANQTFSFVVGKQYFIKFTVSDRSAGAVAFVTNAAGRLISPELTANGNYSYIFTATANDLFIGFQDRWGGGSWSIDDVSLSETNVLDRSYKGRFASIAGTLTKSQVAPGAQLVCYSGFSS